jgi:MtfA peptidase
MPDTLQEFTYKSKNGTTVKYYRHLSQDQISSFNIDTLENIVYTPPVNYENPPNNDELFGKILFVLFITGFILYFFFEKKITRFTEKIFKRLSNYYYREEIPIIKEVLDNYLPFYQTLQEVEKEKFIHRVLRFRNRMIFEFKSDWPDTEKIAYFVSAAAIQVTFGLKDYIFSHFDTIVIHSENYYLNETYSNVQGHVYNGNIHFSWKDFKEGYEYPHNKQNVGLHEMAHALSFECFNVGDEGDYFFKNEFANFSKVARPIYDKLQFLPNNILGSYATTNYHEFWAVCVEVFFEQPQEMFDEIPELYTAISKLLNQDLLSKKN